MIFNSYSLALLKEVKNKRMHSTIGSKQEKLFISSFLLFEQDWLKNINSFRLAFDNYLTPNFEELAKYMILDQLIIIHCCKTTCLLRRRTRQVKEHKMKTLGVIKGVTLKKDMLR